MIQNLAIAIALVAAFFDLFSLVIAWRALNRYRQEWTDESREKYKEAYHRYTTAHKTLFVMYVILAIVSVICKNGGCV